MGQRRVDVAGLGGDVALAGQVVDAKLGAQGLKALVALPALPRPCGDRRRCASDGAAVVQQVDGQLVRRIVDLGRGDQRDPQQVGFLVIARHEDVDAGQQVRSGGERDLPFDRADVDEDAEQIDGHALQFRQIQQRPGMKPGLSIGGMVYSVRQVK